MSNHIFWLSWHQAIEHVQPQADPPTAPVLGWWNANSGFSEKTATLCAAVLATDEIGAKLHITANWPEARLWRFCEAKPLDWRPSDRFPIIADWARDRFNAVMR